MHVACGKCGAKFKLDDAQISKHERVQFKCTKCGEATIINVKQQSAQATRRAPVIETQAISPLPSFARGGKSYHMEDTSDIAANPSLKLPADKTLELAVLAGPMKGKTFPLTKARMVIGRAGTDIEIDDPEISRWHCSIEVKDKVIRLRDLDSTNGLFMDDEKVRAAELQHESQFRLGSSVLQLHIKPKSG
jgi:predicted Zn finger-like uncharacterized protein